MTQHHLDDIKKLAASYPPTGDEKLKVRLERLERMLKFYHDKIPDAPENQGYLFIGFVGSLVYAIQTIKLHRSLTIKLAELAGEDNNENRTDSES